MSETCHLQLATSDAQLSQVQSLAHSIWHQHYPGIISQAQIDYMLKRGYDLSVLRDEVNSQTCIYQLAMVADIAVGFVGFDRRTNQGLCKLHKLYVLDSARGNGVAGLLLQTVKDHVHDINGQGIILQVNKTNQLAIAAYQRWGFTCQQELVVDIGQGYVMDDYLMRLDLYAK